MTDAILTELILVICELYDAWGRRPTPLEVRKRLGLG